MNLPRFMGMQSVKKIVLLLGEVVAVAPQQSRRIDWHRVFGPVRDTPHAEIDSLSMTDNADYWNGLNITRITVWNIFTCTT